MNEEGENLFNRQGILKFTPIETKCPKARLVNLEDGMVFSIEIQDKTTTWEYESGYIWEVINKGYEYLNCINIITERTGLKYTVDEFNSEVFSKVNLNSQ